MVPYSEKEYEIYEIWNQPIDNLVFVKKLSVVSECNSNNITEMLNGSTMPQLVISGHYRFTTPNPLLYFRMTKFL